MEVSRYVPYLSHDLPGLNDEEETDMPSDEESDSAVPVGDGYATNENYHYDLTE